MNFKCRLCDHKKGFKFLRLENEVLKSSFRFADHKVLTPNNTVNLRLQSQFFVKTEEKKIRMSITIDPNIEKIIRDKHINLSSLTNKLLTEYFGNEKNL